MAKGGGGVGADGRGIRGVGGDGSIAVEVGCGPIGTAMGGEGGTIGLASWGAKGLDRPDGAVDGRG
ncbi:hypothetical protein HYS42_01895 [Candidatus Saccharibacteria bacterium]|nr:hypothetical protein [Candidatus Saccharibacteria bacterium]